MAIPKDILLSAYQLIKIYGDKAEEHATQKMWQFKQEKNKEAAATWRLVIDALKEVRNKVPPSHLN